jgi:hypothetical protein
MTNVNNAAPSSACLITSIKTYRERMRTFQSTADRFSCKKKGRSNSRALMVAMDRLIAARR